MTILGSGQEADRLAKLTVCQQSHVTKVR